MADYVHAPVQIHAIVMEDLKRLGPLFDVSFAVSALTNDMIGLLAQRRVGGGFQSDLEAVTYVVFGNALKTFHAIRILCLHGCGVDALALCGSWFENLVDTLYVRQDAGPRAQRYLAFEQIDKYSQVQKVLSRTDLPVTTRAQYETYVRALAPQVQRQLASFPKQACWLNAPVGAKQPSKVTLRDRAWAVGFGVEYDTFYYMFCGYKHTGAGAAAGFMFTGTDGVDVIIGPHTKGVYAALTQSAKYFVDLCGVFQDTFVLELDGNVHDLTRRLQEVADQTVKDHAVVCE